MSLDTLLREAAPAEAGFDAEDVERRVRRVRRRHRVVAGLCGVALLVGGTAAALVLLGQEDRATVVAGPRPGEPQPVPITEAALTASPWLLTGEDSASDRIPHLELFGEAPGVPLVRPGDYRLFGACDQWFGRWSAEDGGIRTELDQYITPYCPSTEATQAADGRVAGASEGVGVVDGDRMTFGEGEAAVTFRRMDPDDAITGPLLVGNWRSGDGLDVRFLVDGGVDIGGCTMLTWRIDGRGELLLAPSDDPCAATGRRPAELDPADPPLRAWRDGERLVVFRPGTVAILVAGAPTMIVNQAELLLLGAYEEMGVEQCCAELSEGGQNAVVGFVWEGTGIFVRAAPYDPTLDVFGDQVLGGAGVLNEGESGTEVIVVCGRFHVTLHEALPGFPIPDAALIAAAEALFPALDCSLD